MSNNSDIASQLRFSHSINAAITGDGTTNGSSIDTADFGGGVVAVLDIAGRTDGSYLLSLEDSDNDSDFAAIDSSKLIGSITAATANSSGTLKKIGAFGTRRYVRAKLVASSVTTGATRVTAILASGAELQPAT